MPSTLVDTLSNSLKLKNELLARTQVLSPNMHMQEIHLYILQSMADIINFIFVRWVTYNTIICTAQLVRLKAQVNIQNHIMSNRSGEKCESLMLEYEKQDH